MVPKVHRHSRHHFYRVSGLGECFPGDGILKRPTRKTTRFHKYYSADGVLRVRNIEVEAWEYLAQVHITKAEAPKYVISVTSGFILEKHVP